MMQTGHCLGAGPGMGIIDDSICSDVSSCSNNRSRRTSSDCGGISSGSYASSDGGRGAASGKERGGSGNVPSASATYAQGSNPDSHLLLGNIAPNVDLDSLQQLLGWFGPVESLRVLPQGGLAFATYTAPQYAAAAKAALEGQALPCVTGGLPLTVRCQQQQQPPRAPQPHAHRQDQDQTQISARKTDTCGSDNVDVDALLSSFHALGLPVPDNVARRVSHSTALLKGAPSTNATSSCEKNALGPAHGPSSVACGELPSRHLFVAYVVQNIDQCTLTATFARYGVVESVRVFPSMHYAFVNFTDVQGAVAAKAALEGHVIPAIAGSRPIQLRFKHRPSASAQLPPQKERCPPPPQQSRGNAVTCTAVSTGGGIMPRIGGGGYAGARRNDWEGAVPASMAEGRPGRRLWVGNVPSDIVQGEVALLFEPFGPLESVRVFPERNFAFVNFMEARHASAARSALNDQMVPSWKSNRTLLVRYPREREPRSMGCDLAQQAHAGYNGWSPCLQAPSLHDSDYLSELNRGSDTYHHCHELGGRHLPVKPSERMGNCVSLDSLGGLRTPSTLPPAEVAVGATSFSSRATTGGQREALGVFGSNQPQSYKADTGAIWRTDPTAGVLGYLLSASSKSVSPQNLSLPDGLGRHVPLPIQPQRQAPQVVPLLQAPSGTSHQVPLTANGLCGNVALRTADGGLAMPNGTAPLPGALMELLSAQLQGPLPGAAYGMAGAETALASLTASSADGGSGAFERAIVDRYLAMSRLPSGAAFTSSLGAGSAAAHARSHQAGSNMDARADMAQLLMQLLWA